METLSDKEILTDGHERIYNACDVKQFITDEDKILDDILEDERPLTKEGAITLFIIRRNEILGDKLI